MDNSNMKKPWQRLHIGGFAPRKWMAANIPNFLFLVVITLAYGLLFTFADFYGLPYRGLSDLLVQVLQWTVVTAATFLLLWALSISRYVFAVVLPPLTLLCAVAAYFRFTAHVTLTPMAIDLAMVNDMRTTMDVVTLPLVLFCLACVALSVWAVIYRIKKLSFKPWYIHAAASLLLLACVMNNWRLARPIMQRIPFNIYAATSQYIDDRRTVSEQRPALPGTVVAPDDSIDVVFILGETLRAKNMQINGYARPTTPLLCKEPNAVSLPHVYSEYGFTHTSVPYILTRANPKDHDAAYRERSFFDIFKRAGFHTAWIANQESVGTFIYFMKEADSLVYVNSGKSMYVFDKWIDGDVMPSLKRQLAANSARRMVLIHTIGSHWWYRSHYPESFARWKPELKSRVLSANTKEEFVNSYDNSVLYSDYFWHQVISLLRQRNAIVIYLSDHAENLGEDGVFGHGEETPHLHYPGCWVWFSDEYARRYPAKIKALRKNARKNWNSDFLFHSIIDAAGIRYSATDRSRDIFSQDGDKSR